MADLVDYSELWETLVVTLVEPETSEFQKTLILDPNAWSDTLRSKLPRMSVGEAEKEFHVHGELGRGGVGVVHLATQVGLDREVALKSLAADAASEFAENTLLQEARVMGVVEHPNVVPIHVIGLDENKRPIIVMKRIQGRIWTDYLHEPGLEHPLHFHLEILNKVCQALGNAHSRGIVHRDIKPDNVMIGAFGEVYLVDWGLAATDGRKLKAIPHVRETECIIGTPAYLAPEMAAADGANHGVHTDVYLLGAVLFEIVTGNPPHQGPTIYEVLRSSYAGDPLEFPASVPAELQTICTRAMARDPAERYESVRAFQEALEDYESHRTSVELAHSAQVALLDLKARTPSGSADDVYRVFGAARFAFEHALSTWKDNEIAQLGLQETLLTLGMFELQNRNLHAAEVALADLKHMPDEVASGLKELRAERAESKSELDYLRRVRRNYNVNVGLRSKSKLLLMLGGGWFAFGWISALFPLTPALYFALILVFLVVLIPVTYVGRRPLIANEVHRAFMMSIWAMWALGTMVRLVVAISGMDLRLGVAFECLTLACGIATLSMTIDRLFLPSAITIAVFGVASAVFLPYAFFIYWVAGPAAALVFAIVSARRHKRLQAKRRSDTTEFSRS